jgi:hypothetical protein
MPKPSRYNPDGTIRRIAGERDEEPPYERPDEDDPIPDEPLPPRRYSREWMRERLGVSGDRDE